MVSRLQAMGTHAARGTSEGGVGSSSANRGEGGLAPAASRGPQTPAQLPSRRRSAQPSLSGSLQPRPLAGLRPPWPVLTASADPQPQQVVALYAVVNSGVHCARLLATVVLLTTVAMICRLEL